LRILASKEKEKSEGVREGRDEGMEALPQGQLKIWQSQFFFYFNPVFPNVLFILAVALFL